MRKHTSLLKAVELPQQETIRATCGARVPTDQVQHAELPHKSTCKECTHEHALQQDVIRDMLINGEIQGQDRNVAIFLMDLAGIPLPEEA